MRLDELVARPTDRVVVKTAYADVYPTIRLQGGTPITAYWLDGVYAKVGTQVAVLVLLYGDALPTYIVIGTYTGTQQREGTVTAVNAPVCTLEAPTGSGNFVTATYLGAAPSVGNVMRLLWQGSDCTALGTVGATPAAGLPPATPQAPTPAAQSGTLYVNAADSGTWASSTGWNQTFGTDVYEGDGSGFGSPSGNTGAWFYNGYTRNLSGLVIQRVRFRIPKRTNAGQAASQAQINLYIHSNDTRPSGDTTRVLGPYSFTILPAQPAQWVDLPIAAGNQLKNGGGVAISGGGFVGFFGLGADGASGQFAFDWSTS